ncbi:MAG: tetratricopeptide repeat protein [Alphaproteobacteria bacterium]|nr:tetratricopeptide repeat protein [Alphaproteobacteria bacterium]
MTRTIRTWAAALALGGMLGGCLGAGDLAQESDLDAADEGHEAASAAGGFLAGRFARAQGDTRAAATYFTRTLSEAGNDPAILQRGLAIYMADGRIDDALAVAQRVVSVNPRHGAANLLLAAAAHKAGKPVEALRRVGAAAASEAGAQHRALVLAWTRFALEDVDGALGALADLPDSGVLAGQRAFHAGLMNELARRPQAAEANYRSVIPADRSGPVRAIEALGGFYERQGRQEEALALYRGFVASSGESPDAVYLLRRAERGVAPPPVVADAVAGLAEAYYYLAAAMFDPRTREVSDAAVRVALWLVPEHAGARSLLGDLFESQGRIEDSLAALEAVPAGSAYGWSSRLRVAQLLDRLDRVGDAAALLGRMAAEEPMRTDAASLLGDLMRRRSRWADAIAAYGQALARLPAAERRHWRLHYARGIALERAKRWPEAEADFLKALELQPEEPDVLNYLGYSWVEMGENLERAQAMIEKAVALRPMSGHIVDSLGWVMFRLGRYEAAVTHLDRATTLVPGDAVINDHLGDALWMVGRRAEAEFQWRRALTLSPEADLAREIERKLREGLRDPKRVHVGS